VGDLFNYAAPDDTSFEEDDIPEAERLTDGGYEDSNAYCLYARKNYKKGEQVCFFFFPIQHYIILLIFFFLCLFFIHLSSFYVSFFVHLYHFVQVLLGYGTYTNLELLEYYGFLLSENPNEKTFIQLDVDICSIGTWPRDSLYIHPNGQPSFALLCALRLWATPVNRRKAVSYQIYSGSMLSTENEMEIMKWLISKCEGTLQQLPTPVEFDESLLIFLHKIQNSTNCRTDLKQSGFEQEFAVFLRFHRLELDCSDNSQFPVRILRSLERWELAVQWRCNYKKTLKKCISYCESLVHELSLQLNKQ